MSKGSEELRPLHHFHGRSSRRQLAYCLSVQQKAHFTELNDHQCNLGGRFRCLLLKSLLAQACPTGTMSTIGSLCESILAMIYQLSSGSPSSYNAPAKMMDV